MPVTTNITPDAIAVALGRATPAGNSPQWGQWQMWIHDAVMLISNRVGEITPTPEIDQIKIDYVVREAVVAQVRRPDDATQVTVSVDDASTSKMYRSSSGRVTILDEWWELLGLTGGGGAAFSVTPYSEDACPLELRPDLWFQWVHPTPDGAP